MSESSKIAKRLSAIRIIHWGISVPLLFFSLVVLMLNNNKNSIAPGEPIDYMLYLPFIITLLALPISKILFRQMTKSASGSLENKLKKYFIAVVVRNVCYEIPGMISCAVALILGINIILAIIPVVALLLYAHRPSATKITEDLLLSREEEDMIRNSK